MNKKTFLDKLRNRLKILNKDEIEDIIEEYEGHINEKVSSGKSEEEAIKDFGAFDELVKEILFAYKINEDYESTVKENNVIEDFVESIVNFVKDFIKKTSQKSKGDVVKFIIEFIILILFIAILKLPVTFIQEFGSWFLEKLISPFGHVLSIIWKYMTEIIYLALSIIGIINFVKKRYFNDDENNYTYNEIKEVNKSKTKKEKIKVKKEKDGSFGKIIVTIIKVSLIFIVIPAIFSLLVSFSSLVIGIILLLQGVPYVGIFICGLTYVSLNYIFLDLCFRFIFNKKINSKILLGSIITTVLLFILGIILSFNEIINTTYIDGVPEQYKKIVKEKKEKYTDDTKLTCDQIHHTSCHYKIDDSMEDDISATITYYDFNNNYEFTNDLEYKQKENSKYSFKDWYNLIINDLKKRQIHKYDKIYTIDLTIKLSNKSMDQINYKKQKEEDNDEQSFSNHEEYKDGDEIYID